MPSSGVWRRSYLLTLVLRSRIFLPWRWRRYDPPKRRFNRPHLHGATPQKMAFFIVTAVKTSNPTLLLLFGCCVSSQISKKNGVIVIIINFYVYMYVYCPFSPHNGITIGNVLIIFFHLLMLNLFFLGTIINLLPLYRLHFLYTVL
jgi:hypothetical protein